MPTHADPHTMVQALNDVGVDSSLPSSDLISFLSNPEFTPYPALAQALLAVLTPRPLKAPVFIDVIAFYYENTPDTASPRRVGDVNTAVLKAAVLKAFGDRYGEQLMDFDSLLA